VSRYWENRVVYITPSTIALLGWSELIDKRSHYGYAKFRRGSMRQVSLREFRTRGVKALKEVPAGETTLLVGQNGPAFFLVPVFGDVVKEDRELRRAMALASLREGWRLTEASGASLASDEDIEAEINRIRRFPDDESECA
jgi:antitoxin (DNA-binding transcriptional repressor) of toxin-antitoxin stability system